MLPAEGKPVNLDNSKQNAPSNENNKEEEAMMRETVHSSTQIAARGQKLDYSEFPRYDPPDD